MKKTFTYRLCVCVLPRIGGLTTIPLALLGIAAILFFAFVPFSLASTWNWNYQTVQNSGDSGYGNSIALDSLGRPHISYVEFDYLGRKYYLKYTYWNGSAWQVQTLLAIGDLGPNKRPCS
ncbi:MAG: hypothetical protein N838_14790 [Thiohalocapsa sp. PB-PSB1]|nr:MAG: hypothetical protein N838_14790 [Thiohalocapsa sp. PB-PSB1]